MKRLLNAVLATFAGLSIISCAGTSQISLDYVPAKGQIMPGHAEFSTRQFADLRGMAPTDIGTVRTQIGTPVEHLHTRIPVSNIVTNAFGYALQARGMLTAPGSARYLVTGEVLDLHCKMVVRPAAYARIRVNVLQAGTGQIVFSKTFEGQRQAQPFVPGSGSPVPVLRNLTSGALQDAVDRALDNRELRSRLASGYPAAPDERPRFVPGML